MRLLLPLTIAAAALPAAAQAEEAPYPAAEVLAAFSGACSAVDDLPATVAGIRAAGWEELPFDAATPLNPEPIPPRPVAPPASDVQVLGGGLFRTTVAGRTLYLWVLGEKISFQTVYSCMMVDFEAPRALTVDELERWAARPISYAADLGDGDSRIGFIPGFKPDQVELSVNFAPPGPDAIGLRGIYLTVAALELWR